MVYCLLTAPESPRVGHGDGSETLQALKGENVWVWVFFWGAGGSWGVKVGVKKGVVGFLGGSPWSVGF